MIDFSEKLPGQVTQAFRTEFIIWK